MAQRPRNLDIYEEVQHDPLTLPPDLKGMSVEDAVEAIKEWFLSNFEDPVHSTPYDQGFVYIWGGPYETRDVVENIFADTATEEMMEAAIEELDRETMEWVPSSSRRQPPEDEIPEPPIEEDLKALYEDMQKSISSLKATLARYSDPPAGIGHNRPPEPLDVEPLDKSDRTEISIAIQILETQPPVPADRGVATAEALDKIESKRAKLASWLLQQGEVFTTEAVKEAGKKFGAWAPRAFWIVLLDQLLGLTKAAGAFIKALQSLL